MARFLNGLNKDIVNIVELQHYVCHNPILDSPNYFIKIHIFLFYSKIKKKIRNLKSKNIFGIWRDMPSSWDILKYYKNNQIEIFDNIGWRKT
jgi:hypothetical protein